MRDVLRSFSKRDIAVIVAESVVGVLALWIIVAVLTAVFG